MAPSRSMQDVRAALDSMPPPRPSPARREGPTPAPLRSTGIPVTFSQTPKPTRSVGRPNAIEVRALKKSFRHHRALDGLSFDVPHGSITGFIGPNGSGKTTTLRILMHLALPDGGTLQILGHGLDEPTSYLPKVGALIEGPAFDPGLSGARNLRIHAHLGGWQIGLIPKLLELVGLLEAGNKPYRAYSLGMKQRLGIAASLLGDPRLLILDEPTNGLDPAGIRDMRDLLERLRRQGKTILVSSHLLSEVERICDHLVVIHDGRLLYQGDVAGLAQQGGLEQWLLRRTGAQQ